MKTAVINVKVDEDIKKRAKAVAGGFGIPLSTLVNAYLIELAETGQIHFTSSEPMTKKMEEIIERAEKQIAAGETSGPFNSTKEATDYLKSL